MRKIIIATPAMDGRVEATYAYSLAETVRLGMSEGVYFQPLMVIRDALIQNVRNDLFAMAYHSNAHGMLWIDGDEGWQPQQALQILAHNVDVVGGTARRKEDVESYVVKCKPENLHLNGDLIEVEAAGTGFLYLSRHAMKVLWDAGEPYKNQRGEDRRWIFDVRPLNGQLVSEDVRLSFTLGQAGIKVYLDPSITCSHTGPKTWEGDFAAWAKKLITEQFQATLNAAQREGHGLQ